MLPIPLLSLNSLKRAMRRPQRRVAVLSVLSSLALASLVAGCGGGGSDVGSAAASGSTTTTTTAAAAAAGTAAFTQGTITGFGSVIVNGVRFDDSSATVTDDDGTARSTSSLRLGMRVEIDPALMEGLDAI